MHRVEDSFVFTDDDDGATMAGAIWRESDSAKETESEKEEDKRVTSTGRKKGLRNRRSSGLDVVDMVKKQVQMELAKMGGGAWM